MTTLLSSTQAGSVILTLNRPERANAFNFEMTTALQRALAEAENDSRVRCVVITGGDNVFSAGQDIGEMKTGGDEISYREHVNGPCAGAAFGIALACDLRIAKSSAYFVVGFSGIGLAPDSGISLFLPKYIGLGRAQEYFYSNKKIPAQLAYEWGMVNRVGGFNYQRMVMQIVGNLATGPREAFAAGKKAFNRAILPNLEEVLNYEGILQDATGKSMEHREGVAAFFEKRKPRFG